MQEGVESLQKPEGFNGETIQYWEKKFHTVMGHLDVIHNAFDAMNYVITHVFPMVEGFNSWRMGNEAAAMESMSQDLNTLNEIKAVFNSCNDPTYWKTHEQDSSLATMINQLVDAVNKDFNGGGFAKSIIDQLKVITHASSNPGLWVNGKLRTGSMWWWNNGAHVFGTVSSYIMWMWSQEWQGKCPFNKYEFQLQYDTKTESYEVYVYIDNKPTGFNFSLKDFRQWVTDQVNRGEPIIGDQGQTVSPIFNTNGTVTYWNGSDWETTDHQGYITWVNQQIDNAMPSAKNDPSERYSILIQLMPPSYGDGANDQNSTSSNPKYSTGPTTQAFAAISTTLNSQSSEQQAKFKFLESSMQQYLGIDKTTMTQFVKQEENILGFIKQQSN